MGLLDEAIREHLELKRRSGADPSLVAREEQEALAPVLPEQGEDPQAHGEVAPQEGPQEGYEPVEVEQPQPVPAHEHVEPERPVAVGGMLSEATEELDMLAAMAEEPDAESGIAAEAGPTWSMANALAAAEDAGEDPVYGGFDWEDAQEDDEHHAGGEDAPGQERLSFE